MKLKKILITILLLLHIKAYTQESQILEFNNRPIRDVLMVLADLTNKNIIPDATVTGTCSYYFSTENLDEALDLFLLSQNLYISRLESAYKVSKIKSSIQEDLISITCKDSDLSLVLDNLSNLTGRTILFDSLPGSRTTLNINGLSINKILEIIFVKYPEYIVEDSVDYLYIKREVVSNNSSTPELSESNGIVLNSDGTYSINLIKVRFRQVLTELFNKAGYEYSIQGRSDSIIDKLSFKNKSFIEMLNLILEGGNSDYVLSNSIYYIFDISKTEVANRHVETRIIELKHIKVKELLKLIPGTFMSNNVLKVDEASNSVIVYGTEIKSEPIIKFISLIDKETDSTPRWFVMNFISSEIFKSLLVKNYPQDSIINVDENSFIMMLNDIEYKSVLELKEKMDIPPKSTLITLKYIKSDILMEHLPKTISADSIILTPNPSNIFYYGSQESYRSFLEELSRIDLPTPQIKYKVLVLQNTVGDNFNFGLDIRSHSENNGDISLPEDDWSSFSGALGGLLNLNFNVLSALGPLFSYELQAALSENRSKILVDTTLQALSGKKVSFRNTTTTRFYKSTTDADGKTESTGATQEVSWGILLDIEGWISGDGMITVNVQSTISDETKVSGEASGIPSTSEKIVNTEVRTKEGEPVVIGGLISSKNESVIEKTPILGDIPLLGKLFQKTEDRDTQSEFIIYLLPYIDKSTENSTALSIKTAYKELID
ncbi:hypothetical protein EW093_05650 [Thiospirochaeta perfilievii]|uniref:NolW-like domain-containing protein n=1 Tax=Thiospirochaeta perfilievii TaxID=252967 RepID=A0A5C1QAY0_9SPIO|nr:secretin N-terminal domain-containing protein [Thiospirochaeta perfilievii]QEN04210.1 hypothetical protein EW093_05650 [Thiospirochaeta perfilievii]